MPVRWSPRFATAATNARRPVAGGCRWSRPPPTPDGRPPPPGSNAAAPVSIHARPPPRHATAIPRRPSGTLPDAILSPIHICPTDVHATPPTHAAIIVSFPPPFSRSAPAAIARSTPTPRTVIMTPRAQNCRHTIAHRQKTGVLSTPSPRLHVRCHACRNMRRANIGRDATVPLTHCAADVDDAADVPAPREVARETRATRTASRRWRRLPRRTATRRARHVEARGRR